MSVARKRAKVKKKRSAKKVSSKTVAKRPRQKKSKRVSVDTKPRVSKKKPKPRRKRKLSPADRSIAAKRGWQTRRLNQQRKAAQSSIDARLAFLRQPQVSAQITEQLIRTNLLRPGMVQSEETQILSRLIVAEQLGNFDQTARELANEFSWDIRDVYTLWHSP